MSFKKVSAALAAAAAFSALAAGAAFSLLAADAAWAHEIEAVHVHESHIAEGLGLALLAAVGCGAVLLLKRLGRRR